MILKEKVTVLSDNNRENIAPDAPGAKFPLKLPSWNHSFTRIVCGWPLVMSIYHLFKKSSPILSRSLRLSKLLRLDWKICKCLSAPSSGFLNLFPRLRWRLVSRAKPCAFSASPPAEHGASCTRRTDLLVGVFTPGLSAEPGAEPGRRNKVQRRAAASLRPRSCKRARADAGPEGLCCLRFINGPRRLAEREHRSALRWLCS